MAFLSSLRRACRRRIWAWIGLAALAFLALLCGKVCKSCCQAGRAGTVSEDPRFDARFLASLPQGFHLPHDATDERLLAAYGAVFVARGGVTPPPVVIFPDEASVARWQARLAIRRADIDGTSVELQAPALATLLQARAEARRRGLAITPRGRDAARRDYQRTVRLWQSRALPGLNHWVREGRLSRQEAVRIRELAPPRQVPEILRLERQGLFFSRDFSESIFSSVAAPGSSQHLSLLALDVSEHANPTVRAILARHGWFQTVISDLPHFTYLGVPGRELPALGLRKVTIGKRNFWVPKIESSDTKSPK